jgi:hypothetical protein
MRNLGLRHCCAILIVAFTAGCSVWRPVPGAGFARGGNDRLDRALLSLRDGSEIELENTTISRDSIVGFRGDNLTRFAIARSEVTRVEGRETNGASTFVVGALVPVAVAFLTFATLFALLVASGGAD